MPAGLIRSVLRRFVDQRRPETSLSIHKCTHSSIVNLESFRADEIAKSKFGITNQSPELFQDLHSSINERDLPIPWVAEIENTSIYGRHGTAIQWWKRHGKVIDEVSYLYDHQSYQWSSLANPIFQLPSLPRPQKLSGRVGLLSCPSGNNYFHFLFDSLPRLLMLQELSCAQFVANTEREYQKKYFDLLRVPKSKLIPVSGNSHYQPETLLLPSLPLPGLNTKGAVAPFACDFIRTLLNHEEIKKAKPSGFGRIWLSRRKGRQIENKSQIDAVWEKHGLREVFLEDLSVPEQIVLFRDASLVCGMHGAGLANLVYCSPGTPVVEILPRDWAWPFYHSVSRQVNLNYHYLIGDSVHREDDMPSMASVNVPCDLFEETLIKAISEENA